MEGIDAVKQSKADKEKPKLRSSKRVKKFSAAMRVVDVETRKVVMKARIDGLEGDNLFG